MIVTVNWLKEFVKCKLSIDEIASGLTMMGLEVEEIVPVGVQPDNADKILLSKVSSVNPHPDADRLKVVKIKNKSGSFNLVTNSSHIIKGDYVVHAQVGTQLANGIEIKSAKLKGVESQGMLLPREFLGLEEKSEDIWILGTDDKAADQEWKVWAQPDHVLHIDLTSNRSDCLSIIGVARELAAMTGGDINIPGIELKSDLEETPKIKVEARSQCPRYSSRIMREVKVQQSDLSIQRKLTLCGIRPINNIVDATNYVLLEFGHPTHAFDLERLAGQEINVRLAEKKEKFVTLDGEEHELNPKDLVIADAEKAVALAGIMGGQNSEILDKTQNILLESAFFDTIAIRGTSKRLGIKTESSHRFERTADWGITPVALARVAQIILQSSPGKVSDLNDQYVSMIKDTVITLKTSFVNKKLGININTKQIEDILSSLQFIITVKRDEELEIKVPTFRSDVYRPIDLVEEVARVYGYNEIPENRYMPPVDIEGLAQKVSVKERIKEVMYGLGFTDSYNYPFTHEQELKDMNINEKTVIPVANPLTNESTHLRNYLFPGMIKTAVYNYNHAPFDNLQMFEIGHIFQQEAGDYFDLPKLGIILSGKDLTYADMLGVIERLLDRIVQSPVSYEARKREFLHPVNAVNISIEGHDLGFAGEIHPDISDKVGSRFPLYCVELHIPPLQTLYNQPLKLKEMSKFPVTSRDLSLIVPDKVLAKDIENTLASFNDWITEVSFVDLYKGANMDADKKSLTYSMVIQNPAKTLTDIEVNTLIESLLLMLKKEYQAELRA